MIRLITCSCWYIIFILSLNLQACAKKMLNLDPVKKYMNETPGAEWVHCTDFFLQNSDQSEVLWACPDITLSKNCGSWTPPPFSWILYLASAPPPSPSVLTPPPSPIYNAIFELSLNNRTEDCDGSLSRSQRSAIFCWFHFNSWKIGFQSFRLKWEWEQ